MQERSYSILLENFERRLRLGELRVGDRLPSERTLAEQYGISRPSVREALRILGALGLIRSSTGSGPKSGAIVISEPSDALSWALRMHIATRNLPVKDVVSTRLLLEGPAARAAANTPDSAERDLALENAREHLAEMDSPDISNERFHFCDTRFHYELSRLSGNIVLDTVIDSTCRRRFRCCVTGLRLSRLCKISTGESMRRFPLVMKRPPMSAYVNILNGSIRSPTGPASSKSGRVLTRHRRCYTPTLGGKPQNPRKSSAV